MDADFIERRGRDLSTKRSDPDRFIMDPQRFDEILAVIRTGLGDIRSCFENVKIADILEEVSTEFANQALESEGPPNFADAAVVLQYCAMLYGRKVDYLYQNVLDVADSFASSAPATAASGPAEAGAAAPAGGKRRRRASCAPAEFAHIPVAASGAATRAPSPPRAPPTLPRLYIELEPRVLSPHDALLYDYDKEPVGLPADFHFACRLQDGFLTDDLSECGGGASSQQLWPLSLLELQAAIAAAAQAQAPGSPRACSPPPPLAASTPLPAAAAPAALRRRKRGRTDRLEDIEEGALRLRVTAGLRAWAAQAREFSPAEAWRARAVAQRSRRLLHVRADLARELVFRGFEDLHPDAGGFPGWGSGEAAAAEASAARLLGERAALGCTLRAGEPESDDDGFFERSSFSSASSDASAEEEPAAAWSARVAAAAAAAEARGGVDVRVLAARLLRALPPPPAPRAFSAVLRDAAAEPHDVARLLLTALFLANAESVEIIPGAAGSVDSFSLRVLSAERARSAVAAADAAPA